MFVLVCVRGTKEVSDTPYIQTMHCATGAAVHSTSSLWQAAARRLVLPVSMQQHTVFISHYRRPFIIHNQTILMKHKSFTTIIQSYEVNSACIGFLEQYWNKSDTNILQETSGGHLEPRLWAWARTRESCSQAGRDTTRAVTTAKCNIFQPLRPVSRPDAAATYQRESLATPTRGWTQFGSKWKFFLWATVRGRFFRSTLCAAIIWKLL